MDKILLLDTSVGSANKGDEIIMECCKAELSSLLKQHFTFTLPTHVSSFHWYQVLRNSLAVQRYTNCKYKFACGTNLLVPHLLTHYPQWNINLFNYKPFKGTILLGVGAGAGAEGKLEGYTKYIYRRLLNNDFYHSARDERSKNYIERLGLKALNTGCVTMWMLTPEHCRQIPSTKANSVVFTLTATDNVNPQDQILIDILNKNYDNIYFWPQGDSDLEYLHCFQNISYIKIIDPTKDAYDEFLKKTVSDYVGTRLHGGVYALRHKRRSIILSIDERASSISLDTGLVSINRNDVEQIQQMISGEFLTDIKMPFDKISQWKKQFKI